MTASAGTDRGVNLALTRERGGRVSEIAGTGAEIES